MITLTLLHPLKAVPVQNWTFEPDSTIRIGRSMDNDVVLYSAVVSRRHIEIKCHDSQWELKNLGANGTYIKGKRIDETAIEDGMIIRLASSGPQIQIKIHSGENKSKLKVAQKKHSSSRHNKDISKDTIIN